MSTKIGDPIPSASFQVMTSSGQEVVTTDELFGGRTVVLVAVPGAFTPTCHNHHIPGFLDNLQVLKEKGVDEVAVVAVNDVHVMGHWAKVSGGEGKLAYLADGNGDFARAIGLDVDLAIAGMGVRSRRYAMLVKDGVVMQLNVEQQPGVADISSAAHLLAQL